MIPEVGAMYGTQVVLETAWIDNCLAQLPPDSVVMADSGYGIFSVARRVHQAELSFLLRMTKSRFGVLCKKATLMSEGAN